MDKDFIRMGSNEHLKENKIAEIVVVEYTEVIQYKMSSERAQLLNRIASYVFHGEKGHLMLDMQQLKSIAETLGVRD